MKVKTMSFISLRRPLTALRRAVAVCLCLLLCGLTSHARPTDLRSAEAARTIARRFLDLSAATSLAPAPAAVPPDAATAQRALKLTDFSAAYLFSEGRRFVLVGKSTAGPAVLGYGSLPTTGKMPPALRAMLARPAASATTAAARSASAYPPLGTHSWQPVAPLLTTIRGQGAPYNRACPLYHAPDGHYYPTLVGCVATAMEQIITYHRAPVVLADTLKGWATDAYEVGDVMPGAQVDTRLILDDYAHLADPSRPLTSDEEAAVDAVARLSFYLGMACHMSWGFGSSGASSYRLVEPLRRVFGYKYVHHLDSYEYAPAAYWNFIAAEVAARRPVYYAGSVMEGGGHAFVIDGIDEDGLFHVNWAYDGHYDGYYRLDVLCYPQPEAERSDETTEGGFFCNQECIAFAPDSVADAFVPDTLGRTGVEVRIDTMVVAANPLTGCHTPIRLFLTNTTVRALTTPFALLINAPTDTALFVQADWAALTGSTIEAHASDTLTVWVKFATAGRQLLSVTADGEQILRQTEVDVAEGGSTSFTRGEPSFAYPAPGCVTISQPMANATTERAAVKLYLCVQEEDSPMEWEHISYLSLPAQTDSLIVETFRGLLPGHTYLYLLRERWPATLTRTFTMPLDAGVEQETADAEGPEEWFTLDGRRIDHPDRRGIYLRRRGQRVDKVMRP